MTIVVAERDGAQAIVDVELVALPRILPSVSVIGFTPHMLYSVSAGDGRRGTMDGANVMDGTTWSAETMRLAPQVAQNDVLQTVATAATVTARSEAPSDIHVTGGSADQNLVMLDGFPIENAVHAGELTSAVDPAIISGVTLYDGRMPASMGGRLASVIAISTRGDLLDARRRTITSGQGGRFDSSVESNAAGTVGTAGVGAAYMAMSSGLNASGLLSVRHSRSGLGKMWFADPYGGQPMADGWSDVLARGSTWIGKGELSVLGFVAHNAVRFGARGRSSEDLTGSTTDTPQNGRDTPSYTGLQPTSPGARQPSALGRHAFFADTSNGFAWRSSAVGIAWRRPVGTVAELDLRAWQSVAITSGAWGIGLNRATITNRFVHTGGAVAVTRSTRDTWLNVGADIDDIRTAYSVADRAGELISNPASGTLTSSPYSSGGIRLTATLPLVSAFMDTRLRFTPWASASVGLRATLPLAGGNATGSGRDNNRTSRVPQLEPRLGLAISPSSRVVLEAGYARTEQRVQSLRNDESVFDNVIGLNLLTAIGNGVPTATSDLGTVRATVALDQSATMMVGLYARHLQNVLLAAPRTPAPFAIDAFDIGSGQARGWYVTARHKTAHTLFDASYSTTDISRGTTRMRYRPGFAAAQSLSLAIAIRPLAHTTLRAAGIATDGRNAAMTLGDFAWNWEGMVGTTRDFQGTPRTALIGRNHIPPYLRLDLGLRHEIVLGHHETCDSTLDATESRGDRGEDISRAPCQSSSITVFASINNVLNRTNTAGYVRRSVASRRATALGLLPRTVAAGLEWHW